MKTYTIFLLLTLAFGLSYSCEKKGDIIQMHFNETGCANPWNQTSENHIGFSNNDPDYQNKVKSYIEQYGMKIKGFSMTNDGPASGCLSCGCTTGRRINISIFEKDKSLAEELGFAME